MEDTRVSFLYFASGWNHHKDDDERTARRSLPLAPYLEPTLCVPLCEKNVRVAVLMYSKNIVRQGELKRQRMMNGRASHAVA